MVDPRNRAYSLLYSNPIWIGKRFLQNLVLRLAINVGVLGAIAEVRRDRLMQWKDDSVLKRVSDR